METPAKAKKKVISFSIDPDLDERLTILAYQMRTSKSSLVEEWIFEKVDYYTSMEKEYAERYPVK